MVQLPLKHAKDNRAPKNHVFTLTGGQNSSCGGSYPAVHYKRTDVIKQIRDPCNSYLYKK